ncbi:MAG: hypothetical protein VX311_08570 [Planctomycetota bacterium]|jgi:hypothetical protein|nr:hypothetical protein [Planctomycetota bacterium]MEC9009881.1 hypothetical protein [Planctomycetota bacterium]MED5400914.1 hypothetical protein [Planctomycetota bacterium]MED5448494.1 hypothetical protein [Planctomycetota bacterium]MEE3284622.1 hypothetical protein [Planctomycetota bacterium]
MRPRLRIFTGEDHVATLPEPAVNITFAELTEILSDASRTDRTWLRDFADDEVRVSPDLYEVLCAFRHLRPSA